jgi:hypothetical protein
MKESVVKYLESIKKLESGAALFKAEDGQVAHYSSIADLLLKEGAYWNVDNNINFKVNVETYPKHCFWNAFKLVRKNKEKLFYVEGYAMKYDLGISIHHAWCVTKDGIVVDPTWGQYTSVGDEYFGLAFELEKVKSIHTKDNLSILYDWRNGYKLLLEKYREPEGLKLKRK